tara:strand:+ start:41452 stop:41943 length:492 start_codon:yes stop_codon:yes gene_type:complete
MQHQAKRGYYVKKWLSLIGWIVALQLVGFLIGQLTQTGVSTWYQTIPQSSLTPPNWVFPVVWCILYIMVAIAGWSLWTKHCHLNKAKTAYMIQLLLNWSWTPIFFGAHMTGLALGVLAVIVVATFMTICFTWKQARLVAYLLLPYLIWCGFAAYLNGYIAFHI